MAENKGPGRLHAYLASYSGSEEPLMRLLPARPYICLLYTSPSPRDCS